MPKKKKEETVQQIDLTELVNYVNYLGEKINELGQATSSNADIRFGMEVVDDEKDLIGTKYFHTLIIDNMCTDIPLKTKEFYYKKYGTYPEMPKIDFYAF